MREEENPRSDTRLRDRERRETQRAGVQSSAWAQTQAFVTANKNYTELSFNLLIFKLLLVLKYFLVLLLSTIFKTVDCTRVPTAKYCNLEPLAFFTNNFQVIFVDAFFFPVSCSSNNSITQLHYPRVFTSKEWEWRYYILDEKQSLQLCLTRTVTPCITPVCSSNNKQGTQWKEHSVKPGCAQIQWKQ